MPLPNVVWPEAYCFCPVRPSVHLCEHPKTLLTWYLAEYLAHVNDAQIALWDRHEMRHILGSEGQSHGVQYAENSTFSFFHNSSGWSS